MRPPRLVAGVAVSLVVVATSCSGGDDSADTTTDSTSPLDSTSPSTSSAATSSAVATSDVTSDVTSTSTVDAADTTDAATDTAPDTTAAPSSAPAATDDAAATLPSIVTTPPAPPLAVSTTTTTTVAAATGWTAPSGEYTVSFPTEPSVFELDPPIDGAEMPVTLYAVETEDYAVLTSRTDYTDYGLDASAIDVESARDLAIDGAAGELTASEDITFQGREGVRYQFVVGAPQIGLGDGMILVDGPVLYQVAGIGVVAEEAFLTAFVDSFAFTEDR